MKNVGLSPDSVAAVGLGVASFKVLNKIILALVTDVTLTAVVELVLMGAFDVPHQVAPLCICFVTNNTLVP